MIPGIVAEQEEVSTAGGTGGYASALLALDFANGLYFVGGVAVALADAIDKPGFVTSGSLQLRFIGDVDNDDLVFVIGDALAAITTNPQATFVFDWTDVEKGTSLWNMQDDNFNSAFWLQETSSGPTDFWIYAEDLGEPSGFNSQERDLNDTTHTFSNTGRHRVAITRDNDALRMSRDGMAVVYAVDAGVPPSPMTTMNVTQACFGQINVTGGSNLQREFNLNSLVVWPVVDDSQLPVLSAL